MPQHIKVQTPSLGGLSGTILVVNTRKPFVLWLYTDYQQRLTKNKVYFNVHTYVYNLYTIMIGLG